jgi:GPI mannosyltransferase 2
MVTTKYPILTLVGSAVAARVVMHVVLLATSYVEPFDASHLLHLPLPDNTTIFRRWASTALRWDAFHFSSVAADGYLTEQSWAFFPGTPLVMRIASSLASDQPLAIGLVSFLANVCSLWSTYDLYTLTFLHTRSLEAAFLVAALSILPSSPVTLSHALYAEPFFAFFSYRGKLPTYVRVTFLV